MITKVTRTVIIKATRTIMTRMHPPASRLGVQVARSRPNVDSDPARASSVSDARCEPRLAPSSRRQPSAGGPGTFAPQPGLRAGRRPGRSESRTGCGTRTSRPRSAVPGSPPPGSYPRGSCLSLSLIKLSEPSRAAVTDAPAARARARRDHLSAGPEPGRALGLRKPHGPRPPRLAAPRPPKNQMHAAEVSSE